MIYELSNNLISLKINSIGAEIISLKTRNNNLEYIWEADPDVWARHAPVLFPIVGKLKNNTFSYQNKEYNLPQHGFARDKEFRLIKDDGNSLSFQLESDPETLKIYPFPFQLITIYTINDNKVTVQHEVRNLQSSEMYFSIGAHPGFRCPLLNESFEDYYLEFEAEEDFVRHKIKASYLSGQQEVVQANGNIIPLTRELFKEDALVFKYLRSMFVTLKNTRNNHEVRVSLEGFPFLGIWTNLKDKANFICIEPWLGIADHYDFNGDISQKEGINRLEGDEKLSCSYDIIIN